MRLPAEFCSEWVVGNVQHDMTDWGVMEQAEATLANLEIVRRWISAINEKKLEDAEPPFVCGY
jgi:hypothetical protein